MRVIKREVLHVRPGQLGGRRSFTGVRKAEQEGHVWAGGWITSYDRYGMGLTDSIVGSLPSLPMSREPLEDFGAPHRGPASLCI